MLLGLAGCGSFAAAAPDTTPGDVDPDAGAAEAGAVDSFVSADGDPTDASERLDASADADANAAVLLLDGSAWTSPNEATWTVHTDGTRISGFAGFNHPLIVLLASATTTSSNYLVTAVIKSPASGVTLREFGLFARAPSDGDGGVGTGVVLGSEYGGAKKLFLAPMGPPDWSPVSNTFGPLYTAKASTRYKMKLMVSGTAASGKLWEASAAEPGAFQVTGPAPAAGKLAGFYTYGVNGAVLESFVITPE